MIQVAGFVLAGGASSRMGRDKATAQLDGRPLIEYALAILRDVGLAASIAGARSELSMFAPIVEDLKPDLGPLSGVCAALESSTARRAVFLSVDQPLLPASLVKYLLSHAEITGSAVTLASVSGFPQTFPAVIDRDVLPMLSADLESGRSGCFSAFSGAAAALSRPISILLSELLTQTGHAFHPYGLPAAHWFLNVNTPADLTCAEAVLDRIRGHFGPRDRVI